MDSPLRIIYRNTGTLSAADANGRSRLPAGFAGVTALGSAVPHCSKPDAGRRMPESGTGITTLVYRSNIKINAMTESPSTNAAAISMLVAIVPLASG
jgi:hypothetical protein